MANKKQNEKPRQNKTDPQTNKALIWAGCIFLCVLFVGALGYMAFPYKYNAEFDCEGDLGDLDIQYQQRFREEHPKVTEHFLAEDGVPVSRTYKDTNKTEFKNIPIMLDINGISGIKMNCKAKIGGTFSHSLLLGMAGGVN